VLIAAVRRGETNAYGLLYERHLSAAKRAAACLAATRAEREDLVAEGFTRVLQTLRSRHGPDEEFRPYLLVTMRHLAINTARRTPATALYAEVPDTFLPANNDPVAARVYSSDAANAFAGLPERWRVVLWHTEIEGESPAAIAPMLGMTPNGVAALAYRAREGLRQAYLRLHLPAADHQDCRAASEKLAGWVRRSISAPQRRKVAAHLDRCARCREVAAGLEQVNGELRGLLAPLVLGTPLAAGYLTGSALATASTGLATVSWLSAVKASGAAAAIAAVTAVTMVASDPGVAAPNGGTAVSAQLPQVQQHTGEIVGGMPPAAPAAYPPAAADSAAAARLAEPAEAADPEAAQPEGNDQQGQQDDGQQGRQDAASGSPGQPKKLTKGSSGKDKAAATAAKKAAKSAGN
jgi:RNA polymerase sigma factor (sigma-70 family)